MTLLNTDDVHGEYTNYLYKRGHSLHSFMNTVHNIWVTRETKEAMVKKRGCSEIPPKLLKHMQWYLNKYYGVEKVEVQ